MGYLIDTNILIYALKGNEKTLSWFEKKQNIPMGISIFTYGELLFGAYKSANREKNLITVKRIKNIYEIINIECDIIELYAKKRAELEKNGTRIDDIDLLIGVTALYRGMTLVTNNTKHFNRITGLVLENPLEKTLEI